MCTHADHVAMGGPEHSFYPIILRISTDSLSAHPLDTHSLMLPGAPGGSEAQFRAAAVKTDLTSQPSVPCVIEHEK